MNISTTISSITIVIVVTKFYYNYYYFILFSLSPILLNVRRVGKISKGLCT